MNSEIRSSTLAALSAIAALFWCTTAVGIYSRINEIRDSAQLYEQYYYDSQRQYRDLQAERAELQQRLDAFWFHVDSSNFVRRVEQLVASTSRIERKNISDEISDNLSDFQAPYRVAQDFDNRLNSLVEAATLDERNVIQRSFFLEYDLDGEGGYVAPVVEVEPVVVDEAAASSWTDWTNNIALNAVGAICMTFALCFMLFHGRKRRRLESEMQSLEVEKAKLQVERMRRGLPQATDHIAPDKKLLGIQDDREN